jgi:hypothetical protein
LSTADPTKNPKQKNLIISATLTSERQRREAVAVPVLELKNANGEKWRGTVKRGGGGQWREVVMERAVSASVRAHVAVALGTQDFGRKRIDIDELVFILLKLSTVLLDE